MTSDPKRVMVGCVGHNLGSCLIVAREFEVDRVVLVCTPETRREMRAIATRIDVPVREVMLDDQSPSIADVEARVREALELGPDEHVVLDVTGGTKLMSIGTWLVMSALPPSRWLAVYLEAGAELLDPRSGKRMGYHVAIEIEEVLAWHQRKIRHVTWRGLLSEVPPDISRRVSLGAALMKVVAEKRVRQRASRPNRRIGRLRMNRMSRSCAARASASSRPRRACNPMVPVRSCRSGLPRPSRVSGPMPR